MKTESTKENITALADALGVSAPFAEILTDRGYATPDAARAFLYPTEDMLSDPFALSGMEAAVTRIREAIANKERIVIFGDYDCDGIVATSILYDYLLSLGVDVYYYIPNRFGGGYGLTIETLETIAESVFPDLIVTVDCGISSVEEAEYLAEDLAIDLIVTDHHNLPQQLPNAIILNPKLDLGSPCYGLAGAGVALKLVEGLAGREKALSYVDLAAIATVADVVPLTEENRVIVSLGLKKINERRRVNKGLRMLIESCDLEQAVTSYDIGHKIAPKINAVGRVGDATEMVRLFVSDEYVELQGLVEKADTANELRRSLRTKTYEEALEMLKDVDLAAQRIIFLYKEDWNTGIIGLVAASLAEAFSRPTVILCGEETIRGSARAPEGIDIFKVLQAADSLLIRYGGHKGAAGLSVERENLIAARNMMDDYLHTHYTVSDFAAKDRYDADLPTEAYTVAFAEELALLEPTGEGNEKPIFRIGTDRVLLTPMGNAAHAKGRLNDRAEVVAFGGAYISDAVKEGVSYDLFVGCTKEVFKNREKVQLKVRSVAPSGYAVPASEAISFHRYLRSAMYKESAPAFTPIRFDEVKDTFYDDDFCTLIIAFSSATVTRLLSDAAVKSKVGRVDYARATDQPHNAIVISPDFIPTAYKHIILADTPLTKGYISFLNKYTNAELFVVTDNYPYKDILARTDLSPVAVQRTYNTIRSFVYAGNAASSAPEFFSKIGGTDPYQTVAHFYALYDSGSIRVGQGFALSPQAFVDPSESTVYRRLNALKRQV